MCERWLNFERLLIAPTFDAVHEKIDEEEGEGPRPKATRANTRLGEAVTAATLYGRARRARLKAMAESR